ncbi:guanine-1-methyltransferase-domain-containing protein [Cokeromyces recurvatus]|uniref:guanine-1-methyltransferase-domain-containing protein n=1 Tax=Cokeromyces recurvatus TaxID=90255 RepID=UPI00221FEF49|nr:guanine-1-methyltransferase-domain-containing protein [Cokeromyces recurvatus]KAI7908158.1 guanine-1-methyltransferase-domain-containing protein [Cokeromyces recurvatus]
MTHDDHIEETKPTIRNFRGIEYDINDPKFQGLSKRAIKRLLRDEKWEETKDERKIAMREKVRLKRIERRKLMREGVIERPPTKKKLAYLSEVTNVGLIIDCSFNHLMTEKEIQSFVKQLSYSYGKNKTAPKAMKLALTSFDDTLKQVMNDKLPTWQQWIDHNKEQRNKVSIHSTCYLDLFPKESLVYLSADSDNVIEKLEEGKYYIIGGIVDKNRYKNLCQDKAVKQDIQTARLPISDYLQMSSRKVLTVNQVCEIMLKWLEFNDWQKAFMEVIPGRKLKDVQLVE